MTKRVLIVERQLNFCKEWTLSPFLLQLKYCMLEASCCLGEQPQGGILKFQLDFDAVFQAQNFWVR